MRTITVRSIIIYVVVITQINVRTQSSELSNYEFQRGGMLSCNFKCGPLGLMTIRTFETSSKGHLQLLTFFFFCFGYFHYFSIENPSDMGHFYHTLK